MTEKDVNMKIKGNKNRELETYADKERILLTRRVHRMKGETAIERETITKHAGISDRENEFRMKHLIKGSKFARKNSE